LPKLPSAVRWRKPLSRQVVYFPDSKGWESVIENTASPGFPPRRRWRAYLEGEAGTRGREESRTLGPDATEEDPAMSKMQITGKGASGEEKGKGKGRWR